MFLKRICFFYLLSIFHYQILTLTFSSFWQKWLTVSKCFYQCRSTERQWRGIKRAERERRRRKEIGGDKCCWDSRCSRKSCVFVTFLKERVTPALTGLHQQWGDVGLLRLVKDQRCRCILQHSPYTSDLLEGHCGSRSIFFTITLLYTLSRYNSLIEDCCVFQLWAFATTPCASLIEFLSSCATRQAPLREIRLLSRLLQIRVMWGHGHSEEKSLHPCCLSAKEEEAGVCQGATGPRLDVKYTVWLAAVKDLRQLLICASRAFDLLSTQVEVLLIPPFCHWPTGKHTLPSLHITFFPQERSSWCLKWEREVSTEDEVRKREGKLCGFV